MPKTTKLACDLPALHTQQNAALFVSLVSTAHALLVDTHVDLSGEQEDNMGVHEITSGASTSFHRLAFASKFEVDHCREIDDEKFWAESVARVIRGIGGAPATAPHLAPLLTQQAPPIVTQNLVAFISRFNLI
ncbi:hypothetical protein Pelo_897 [Pelomyxa schiedti]|nr:hypothetical protein Pelo_897 [Pelomyxa schiedti]